jgi:hypothetical protein
MVTPGNFLQFRRIRQPALEPVGAEYARIHPFDNRRQRPALERADLPATDAQQAA